MGQVTDYPAYWTTTLRTFYAGRAFTLNFPNSFDPTSASFGFEDLEVLLNSEDRPESINALLSVLKERDPQLFAYPVLLFRSKSLQEASVTHPRVILMSTNGRFTIAFNGDPRQRGYSRLEVMEYDWKKRLFQFHEVIEEAGDIKLRKDPTECLSCHSNSNQDPRMAHPLWDSYKTWPGAFGGMPSTVGKELWELDKEAKRSAKNLRSTRNPRYSLLKNESLQIYELLGLSSEGEVTLDSSPRKFNNRGRHGESLNNRLTVAFQFYNLERLAFRIRSHPNYTNELADFETQDDFDNVNFAHRLSQLGINLEDYVITLKRQVGGGSFSYGESRGFLKHLSNLMKIIPVDTYEEVRWAPRLSARDLLERDCVECHRGSKIEDIPIIPFDDDDSLRRMMTPTLKEKIINRLKSDDSEYLMPQFYPPLEPEEIQLIEEYLKAL